MGTSQQYCLRWNNHRSNLLTVFDELLQNEAFTDVTLACDGGSPIKCHRMVLAACSPYFQNIFTDLPCKHPVVVLKDVKYSEIKAILEYMYKGEVNVAQDQLAALLKVAEALKVKGLVEENRGKENREMEDMGHSPSISTSNNSSIMQNTVHSSSNSSPPHSTNSLYKSPYSMYSNKTEHASSRIPNFWAVPGLPLPPHTGNMTSPTHPNSAAATAAAALLSNCYDSPLKRKKLSSLLMNRDTPILRNVLGRGNPADSSQPVSLVCHPDSNENLNGHEDMMKHMKNEPFEDAQSPYTDFTPPGDEEEKSKLAIPSSSPQSYSSHHIASYVQNQKPEWKRYKQYTRADITSAIDAVRNGMSALQAAKKYGVPSRTLYDKVKKMGITTSRPFRRGPNGSSASFSYGSESGEDNNMNSMLMNNTALMEALDARHGEREALQLAIAHAVASGHNTSPNYHHGRARSPSPSPTMLKYIRQESLTPSPAPGSDHHLSETNGSSERDHYEDDSNQVEDLSVHRKQVIVPPMSIASILKKEESLIDSIKQEHRREISVDGEVAD